MSVTHRIAFGAGATWFSRGVTIVLGLLLMPILFRHLPKEELGVWLLLGQSWVAMGILDLGLAFTLTRRIALAKGKSGGDPDALLTSQSRSEIADLVESGRRIYQFMAVGVFGIAWVAGFFYLRNLDLHGISHTTVWIAWTVLCASQGLNVWATIWTCLMRGVGYVGWDALVATFVNGAMLAGQIAAVLCGGGLVALASIATLGALLQRWLTRWVARRRRPELFALRGRWNRELMESVPGLAFRAWLTAVGSVLVFSTDQFFIASAKGAASIPAFRAAYVLVHNATVVAVSLALASSVFVSHLWQSGELQQVQRIVERNCRLSLLVMLCAGALLMTSGGLLFDLWLGPGNFVGYSVLAVFLIYETLEAHSYVISTSSRATNDEAFAVSSMAAGLVKIGLAVVLVRRYGLLGLAIATMLALLATNHWYMVYRGLRRLQLPLLIYAKEVAAPSLFWSGASLLGAAGCRRVLSGANAIVQLAATSGTVGVFFAAAVIVSVISPAERESLLRRFTKLTPSRSVP